MLNLSLVNSCADSTICRDWRADESWDRSLRWKWLHHRRSPCRAWPIKLIWNIIFSIRILFLLLYLVFDGSSHYSNDLLQHLRLFKRIWVASELIHLLFGLGSHFYFAITHDCHRHIYQVLVLPLLGVQFWRKFRTYRAIFKGRLTFSNDMALGLINFRYLFRFFPDLGVRIK